MKKSLFQEFPKKSKKKEKRRNSLMPGRVEWAPPIRRGERDATLAPARRRHHHNQKNHAPVDDRSELNFFN